MRLFNTSDILRNFNEQDRNRGRIYQQQGRVRELRIENAGARIHSKVQGTSNKLYDVTITVEKIKGPALIHAECTCPVAYMCKHATATLFETIAQWDRQREKLPASQPYEDQRKKSLDARGGARRIGLSDTTTHAPDAEALQRLVYLIGHASNRTKPEVIITPALGRMLKNGLWGKPRHCSFHEIIRQNQRHTFLMDEDHAVFRSITASRRLDDRSEGLWWLPEDPTAANHFLEQVVKTGRAFPANEPTQPLKAGPPMSGRLAWVLLDDDRQRPVMLPAQAGVSILMSNNPWYIDPATYETGPLVFGLPFFEIRHFLDRPPLTALMANKLSQELATANSALPPPYQVLFHNDGRQVEPVPHLHVQRAASGPASVACLTMLYGEARINPLSPSAHYCITTGNQLHLYKRDKKAEAHSMKQLAQFGLRRAPYVPPNGEFEQPACVFGPADQSTPWFWLDFATESVPCLQESHFHIEIDADCCMDVVTTDDESIEASFTQNGAWWFSLDLGITINGQRTALLPILVSFLRLIHSPDDLDRLTAGKRCYVPLPDGRHVALPSERVKTILQTLIELFGPKPLDDKGQLRISFDLASALLKIKDFTRKRWFGEGQLKNLVEKLSNFEGIAEAPLPAGLHAELRPYQKQGYDWLHFLGAYNLGGVLADDMGLGKTVQALAYILALKKSKKTNPCLVIMPTSLISNWQTEAARFAPYLKIVTLHGKDRAILFDTIESADLVFSTYPLVIRDIEKLASYKWGLVILDEAQAIKNPTSKITQAVCMLDAKQRLCLTGTPLENHLGEIWSIFAFLMPGLLGDYNDFSRQYRTPIEKHGDAERQTLLSRRLRPFILRRLKTNVAKELPPKTEIIQRVTLGDDQRDLYETVRHVMNDKLRDEISNKGFARSQIAILDALLKLRQVCCDPRLVKIAVARKATTSAKLEALMEMLPTLIEDGRRILLFSQFTSMLDLIKPALDDARIPYVELRGTTKDRRTPISKFQKKEVPLFLISLKAGGTGLNLTAADTVIHFDPWWNPSVENQATDRAHRIGQDKPVFVYKLIANGTVEERILDLQAKKANLANAIFGDKPSVAPLTQDDMRWLLEGV